MERGSTVSHAVILFCPCHLACHVYNDR